MEVLLETEPRETVIGHARGGGGGPGGGGGGVTVSFFEW